VDLFPHLPLHQNRIFMWSMALTQKWVSAFFYEKSMKKRTGRSAQKNYAQWIIGTRTVYSIAKKE
jgi:hypothetical protein